MTAGNNERASIPGRAGRRVFVTGGASGIGAAMVLFLASGQARAITAQEFIADAGWR